MKVKYVPVFTNNPETQIEFFTQKLGFKLSDKDLWFEGTNCKVIETGDAEVQLVLINKLPGPEFKNHIILNTDDCLNDYHLLKTVGVKFFEEPQYQPVGLVANFTDCNGNKVILLEERNYNE